MDLIPARMVNEFVYCPRLFWLEYVEREFEESHDTVDGDRIHRRVDRPSGVLPDDVNEMKAQATSVELASETLGVVAKVDVVRADAGEAVPIDFKRGKAPSLPGGAYPPERVQLCLQGLLLREAGYASSHGLLYFAASKTQVRIEFDDALISETLAALEGARRTGEIRSIPAPLVNSPKCPRCSLNAICLPDETSLLRGAELGQIRPFVARKDERVPVYVTEPGARVGIRSEVFEIKTDAGTQATVRAIDAASFSLFGPVQMSSQAARAALARDIPIFYLSYGGWISGFARSIDDHSLDLRVAQHAISSEGTRCIEIARCIIYGKVKNQRTLVRRSVGESSRKALQEMALLLRRIETAKSLDDLLGFEGNAAKIYFERFGEMLKVGTGFEVSGRNRRPPTDPVNALLSFGYSMLTKEALAAVIAVGFEPGLGFLHRVRPGRPSLALDLMEEFRPLVVDSVVLSLINTGEIKSGNFDRRGKAIVLTADGRKIFIQAMERRLRSSLRHPTFGYDVTYRRALNVQARLLARTVQGDISAYPPLMTR